MLCSTNFPVLFKIQVSGSLAQVLYSLHPMRYVEYYILYSCPLKDTAKFWTSITEIFYLSPMQEHNLKLHSNFIGGVKFPQQ